MKRVVFLVLIFLCVYANGADRVDVAIFKESYMDKATINVIKAYKEALEEEYITFSEIGTVEMSDPKNSRCI